MPTFTRKSHLSMETGRPRPVRPSCRCLAVALLLVTLCVSAATTNDPLAALQSAHAQKTNAVEATYQQVKQQADAGYVKDLQAIYQHMNAKQDEFGLRPMQAEGKRYQQERTVPRESPEGTPELLVKARARYYALLDPAEAARSNQLRQLAARYQQQLQAAGTPAATNELARLAAEGGGATTGTVPARSAPLRVPESLLRGLRLAYSLAGEDPSRLEDLSGRGRHGALSGAMKLETSRAGVVREFARESDQIGVPPQKLGKQWTLAVLAQFPLERPGQPRVLMSGGFRQHHVLVDERGRLGVQAGDFVSSGYDVSGLKGWHELVAVADGQSTYFFVDGRAVGHARAACGEAISTLGNGGTGGQPWGGLLSALLLWGHPLTTTDITVLTQRHAKPAAP
jgi:hypothetical protein